MVVGERVEPDTRIFGDDARREGGAPGFEGGPRRGGGRRPRPAHSPLQQPQDPPFADEYGEYEDSLEGVGQVGHVPDFLGTPADEGHQLGHPVDPHHHEQLQVQVEPDKWSNIQVGSFF